MFYFLPLLTFRKGCFPRSHTKALEQHECGHTQFLIETGLNMLSPVLSWNTKCTETENCIHFWAERCQKYSLFRKKFQIKVSRHRISDEKVREGMCLSSPWLELWASKDDTVEKSECIFPFLYNLIFKPYHLSSPLAPFQGEIDICPCGLFCPKFDAEKLLFKPFFEITRIFGSVQPKSECNFPFLYNLISFEAPSSTLAGDRHIPSRTFLSKIRCWKTFI